jgi:hypothetical protein
VRTPAIIGIRPFLASESYAKLLIQLEKIIKIRVFKNDFYKLIFESITGTNRIGSVELS